MKKTVIQIRQTTTGLMESTNQFLTAFNRSQYRLIVVFLKGAPSEKITASIPADQVIYLNSTAKKFLSVTPTALYRLNKIIRSEKPEILLAHRYRSIFVAGLLSALHPKATKIAVLHGNGQLNRPGRRLFSHLFLKNRFYFIGISEVVRRDLLNSRAGITPEKTFSTPNAIDIDAQKRALLPRETARAAINAEQFDFVIGTIGRLSTVKNQKLLIEAFARLADKLPGAGLVVIGGGKLHEELRNQAESFNIAHRVKLTGHLDNAANLIPAFDLFVMTSDDEGFGRVLLEAMVARCPIIATRIPAFTEVLKGSGRLVPTGDSKSLSEALYRFSTMSPTERQQFLIQQDHILTQEYSLQGFADRFHQVLRAIHN